MKSMEVLRPQVTIVSNLHFYIHAALALQDKRLLRHFVFTIGKTKRNKGVMSLLPSQWQKKVQTRDLESIHPSNLRVLWIPEIIQRGLPALGLTTTERGNLYGAYLIDYSASSYANNCDIFHFGNGLGLRSAQVAKSNNCITVCDMRAEHPAFQQEILAEEYDILGLQYKKPYQLLRKRFELEYDLSDYFIVPSQHAKQTYVSFGLPQDKIFVVPYGVDFSQFDLFQSSDDKTEVKIWDNKFRIIYVGQVTVRKGVHYLINAFRSLAINDSELLIVGGFPEKEYEEFLKELAKSDTRIKFLGQVPKIELRNYYNMSSVFVLPSLADSFGLVTLEAMACGLPVIVTENSGSGEIVREGADGFVIPIRHVNILIERLNFLHNNVEQRKQMGMSASRTARKFTWEQYASTLLNVYEQIMDVRATQQRVKT